jgi:pre-mRNA-splicing helicase BRR2
MLVQALWDSDSPLMQLPHVTKEIAARCKEAGVEGIFDLMDMEDPDRRQLLQLPAGKLDDIARFCNQYPNIEVAYEVEDPKSLNVGDQVVVNVCSHVDSDSIHLMVILLFITQSYRFSQVSLDRDLDEDELASAQRVIAPRYPKEKLEGWWVVLGDPKTNALLAIKRITLNKSHLDVKLEFEATQGGKQKFKLFLMCDCYMGCDQEHEITLNIGGSQERMDEDE